MSEHALIKEVIGVVQRWVADGVDSLGNNRLMMGVEPISYILIILDLFLRDLLILVFC